MASAESAYVKDIGRFKIFADDDHIIGRGATGLVYEGVDPANDDNPVAAKKISVLQEFLEEGGYEREAEMLLHKIPPHENIIKLHEFKKREYMVGRTAWVDLWLVMDFCEHKSMDVFAHEQNLNENKKLDIIYQSSLALEHLHLNRVTHRDIKPENILVTGDLNKPVVKLADFGTARIIEGAAGKSKTMDSLAGTMDYMAPEQLKRHDDGELAARYHKSVDIFSLGLSILALLESRQGSALSVFKVGKECLGEAMQKGRKWSKSVPPITKPSDSALVAAIKEIITEMIQPEPSDRITITEVVQWLAVIKSTFEVTLATKQGRGPHVRPKVPTSSRKTPMSLPRPTEHTSTSTRAPVKPKDPQKAGTSRSADVKLPAQRDTKQTRTDKKVIVPEKPRPKPDVKSKNEDKREATITSVSPRVTSGVPASVQTITRHNLGFEAYWIAGLNERGNMVLADNNRMHKFTHNGQNYSETLNLKLPEGIKRDCFKALDANNRALIQAKCDSDTVCYNDAGKVVYRLKHKGILINIIGHELFYRQQIPGTDDDWRIQVHRGTPPDRTSLQGVASTRPVTLQPPAPHRWGADLYVCRVQDRYYVTEYWTNSLDIFTTEGRHVLHEQLQYPPAWCNAITSCPSGHLLIAENYSPATIHIHELSGREEDRFTHQDLQLGRDVEIHGICYSQEDEVLHVCVGGSYDNIHSLHAYRVQYK